MWSDVGWRCAGAHMADIVNKAIDNLDGVEGALEGKGDMPDRASKRGTQQT